MKTKHIEVVPYNPDWPRMFEVEAAKIKETLSDNGIEIHHIGSTSVPGLAAKPTIDIIAVVRDTTHLINRLESIEYQYKGEFNIPFHFGFSKRGITKFNLHVYAEGNPEIELNLLFRDYLRAHSAALNEYAQLKAYLLTQPTSFEKNNSKFTGYNLGKDDFIRKVLEQAGFNRIRFRRCAHYAEWDAAKLFRQKYFFDKVPVSDPYTWTFEHPEHEHFVLSQGTEIIGYAHLQFWSQEQVAMRIIVIDEAKRDQGFGGQFLALIEKWLKNQGYGSIHTESSPKALAFYKKHGYVDMPFGAPDGYVSDPRDIAMGKVL